MTDYNKPTDLGPLETLLEDPDILEIMVNGYDSVYVEKRGQMEHVPGLFEDEAQAREIVDRILESLGRRVDESHPICDARLPDGSRMHVVIPPIATNGVSFAIRKMSLPDWSLDELLDRDVMNADMAAFLTACIAGRMSIVISGGAGAGKTTLLQSLMRLIPLDERLVVVEIAGEIRTPHHNAVHLETRPPNLEGKGGISATDLVISALRMRPDRVILSEARGEEVLHLLQAMNSGHDGSMLTMHAGNPHDALARLEVMAMMGNPSIPLLSIRQQLASAIHLIVHIDRLNDGSRKIVRISEVTGMQGDVIGVQDIFQFEQTGIEDGAVVGEFVPTGVVPGFLHRLVGLGIGLPGGMFKVR